MIVTIAKIFKEQTNMKGFCTDIFLSTNANIKYFRTINGFTLPTRISKRQRLFLRKCCSEILCTFIIYTGENYIVPNGQAQDNNFVNTV